MKIWIKSQFIFLISALLTLISLCSYSLSTWHGFLQEKETANSVEKKVNLELEGNHKWKFIKSPNESANIIIKDIPIVIIRSLFLEPYQSFSETFPVLGKAGPVEAPTSDALPFVANLRVPWKIPDLLLTPHTKFKTPQQQQLQNVNCFVPPENRQNWGMITLVKSMSNNWRIRKAIRETWGSVSRLDGVSLEVVFLVSRPLSLEIQEYLLIENERFGDILQVDIGDSAKELSFRSIAGMKWINTHFPSNYLFSSIDEEVMINLEAMTDYLTHFVKLAPDVAGKRCTLNNIFPFICGLSYRRKESPPRDAKSTWFLSKSLYSPDFLPPHCQGGFYTTSVFTSRLIVNAATKTLPITADAVWITGILRQKLGLRSSSIIGEKLLNTAGEMLEILEGEDIPKAMVSRWETYHSSLKKRNILFNVG